MSSNRSLVSVQKTQFSVERHDRFWPPRGRDGKVMPHRMETAGFIKAVPHVLAFFDRRVPPEFWTEGADGDGPIITIACRCGAEPVLHFGIRSYSIAECDCGRFFLHDGKEIRVGHDHEKLPRADPEPAVEPEPADERQRREVVESDLAWQP